MKSSPMPTNITRPTEDEKRAVMSILAYCKRKLREATNGKQRHRYRAIHRNFLREYGGTSAIVEWRLQGVTGNIVISECKKCHNFVNENDRRLSETMEEFIWWNLPPHIDKADVCYTCKRVLYDKYEKEQEQKDLANERNHKKRSR